jgi:Domain of unknown function (DUF4190)/zinc-ribbon domain
VTDRGDPSFCTACGARLDPGQRYCGACGAPVSGVLPGPLAAPLRPPETSGKAIAALVLGIAGVLFVPLVCSILAIVLGRQAKREIEAEPRLSGEGMATAGSVLGIVGLCLFAIGVLLLLLLVAASQPG